MTRKERISRQLREIGAAWAVTDAKTVFPGDGFDAKPTYHVHPDADNPHEGRIRRFETLDQLEGWLRLVRQYNAGTIDEATLQDKMFDLMWEPR